MPELLVIENLSIRQRATGEIVLHPLSLTLQPFRTLGIVGESGSCKTLLAKAILGLLPDTLQASGEIRFGDERLMACTPQRMQQIRGRDIGIVVQHGMGAFDPQVSVGRQFLETLRYQKAWSKQDSRQHVLQAFERVGLVPAEQLFERYPHQLSGGQLQRMLIAMAMLLAPRLIIADEPTTALDVITQAGIIEELQKIVEQRLSTLMFITHDVGLVRHVADDVAVMHQGRLVEYQSTDSLWAQPQHPYTRYLLATRQRLTARFEAIVGGRNALVG